MSAGFFDDESGQFPGGEGVAGFFHAFLEVFKHHHIPEDDAEGFGGVDAGLSGSGKDAFPQGSRRLVQGGVLEAGFGKFSEKPFHAVFRLSGLVSHDWWYVEKVLLSDVFDVQRHGRHHGRRGDCGRIRPIGNAAPIVGRDILNFGVYDGAGLEDELHPGFHLGRRREGECRLLAGGVINRGVAGSQQRCGGPILIEDVQRKGSADVVGAPAGHGDGFDGGCRRRITVYLFSPLHPVLPPVKCSQGGNLGRIPFQEDGRAHRFLLGRGCRLGDLNERSDSGSVLGNCQINAFFFRSFVGRHCNPEGAIVAVDDVGDGDAVVLKGFPALPDFARVEVGDDGERILSAGSRDGNRGRSHGEHPG